MDKVWILVAQGAHARVLSYESNQAAQVVKEFSHIETSKKNLDINTDRPGRRFDVTGPAKSSMENSEDQKNHERQVFALQMVNFLLENHNLHHFNKLVLVASPSLLGQLRKAMPDSLKKTISHTLNKDYCSQDLPSSELIKAIKKELNILNF